MHHLARRLLTRGVATTGRTIGRASMVEQSTARATISARWCSTASPGAQGAAPAGSSRGETASQPTNPSTRGDEAADQAQQMATLHEELDMLLDSPIPIGVLFKTLSPESRKFLGSMKIPLETFLLRHPAKYSVFKSTGPEGLIKASRCGDVPQSARLATEKTSDQMFNGKPVPGRSHDGGHMNDTTKIYTVLKYIPNEWVSYTALNIPSDVRKKCIGKPPKKFFEKHPRYFEVRFDLDRAHSFDVRRSIALQQYMAAQEAQRRQQQ